MPVTQKNSSFAQQIVIDRRGDDYVYGGNWDPFNRKTGTDCSGCVTDVLDAAHNGTAMEWTRHGLSTESWRPPSMGGSADVNNGPFGTVMCPNNDPTQFPSGAAVLIALHHGPGGGANSHMWCQVENLKIETNGSNGTVLNDGATFDDTVLDVHTVDGVNGQYGANNWWYLPGPVTADGTPIPHQPSGTAAAQPGEAPDTLFADVSEFQAQVTDAYAQATYTDSGTWNFRWLSIRSNDGDHVDANFAANYAWCTAAVAKGWLNGFIVYYYWRPGSDAVNNHMAQVNAAGGPHPSMVSMIDLESGDGNPSSDVSSQVNSDYNTLAQWLGNEQRVIGYANLGDEQTMWQMKPEHIPMILAGYGSNPNDPNVFKIAHQYTDGSVGADGLPSGAPPFGNCDMNSADGLSPSQLANALGVGTAPTPIPTPAPAPAPPAPAQPLTGAQQQDIYNWTMCAYALLFGELVNNVGDVTLLPGSPTPTGGPWPLGTDADGQPLSIATALAALAPKQAAVKRGSS